MGFDTENVNIPTDFTVGDVNLKFGSDEASASSVIKKSFDFVVDDSSEAGTVIRLIDLDTEITDETLNLSKFYEEFSFTDLKFAIQSHSPMGSASGGVQVAHHLDPENGNYGTDLPSNIAKAVRQSGSILVRPRDTKDLVIDTHETLYCKLSTSKRFSSFGVVAFIVRATPATGDECRFTVTMEGTMNFHRPTIVLSDSTFTDQVVLRPFKNTGTKLYLYTPDILLEGAISAYLHDPLILSYELKTRTGGINTKVIKLKQVDLRLTGSVQILLFDALKLLPSNVQNVKILCPSILKTKLTIQV